MLDVMKSNEIGNKNIHDETKQIYNEKKQKQKINNNQTSETRDFLAKKRRPSEQRKRKRIFVFIETEIRSCNRPLQRS